MDHPDFSRDLENLASIPLPLSATVYTQVEKSYYIGLNLVGCVMDASPNAPKI